MHKPAGKMLLALLLGVLGLAGCAAPRTVHEFMAWNGFDKPWMGADIRTLEGWDEPRDLTQDIPAILEAMKQTTVASRMEVSPTCALNFNTGSSRASQNLWISISDAGNGYIDYMGQKWFFTGAVLRGFCAREFARSKRFGWNFPQVLPRFRYYLPVPGRYFGDDPSALSRYFDDYLPLRKSSR